MFGGAGFRFWQNTHEVIGLSISVQGLVMVHLCAPEDAKGVWMVSESRTAHASGMAGVQAEALAAYVRKELEQSGWEKLPLALALPIHEAEVAERELSAPLTGEELREALLWSLRAEADAYGRALPSDRQICCAVMDEGAPYRYWTAQMDGARVRAIFSAFAGAGLHLRWLTICPPDGGTLAPLIAAAREPRMPWETGEADGGGLVPAVYAGLLARADTPAHLYWSERHTAAAWLRPRAAGVIAVLSSALFLAVTAADVTACIEAWQTRDRAGEELVLRETELRRMEAFFALHAEVADRERILTEFSAASLPQRALLVHLGQTTADGVRFLDVKTSASEILMEGEAVNYAAFAAFMKNMEDDAFFSEGAALEHAEQEQRAAGEAGRVRFALRAVW